MPSDKMTFRVGDWQPSVEVDVGALTEPAKAALAAFLQEMGSEPIPITDYVVQNPGPDGKRRFYGVAMGPYKNPVIREEPDGGWDCPANLQYVDPFGNPTVRPTVKIVGAVFQEYSGAVARADGKELRFSFSNPDAPEGLAFAADGTLVLDGRTWHLVRVHAANKNRIVGMVAYFRVTPQTEVIVSELVHVGV